MKEVLYKILVMGAIGICMLIFGGFFAIEGVDFYAVMSGGFILMICSLVLTLLIVFPPANKEGGRGI